VPNPNAIVPIATAFITAPSRINFILFTASLLEANTHQASPAFQTKTHLNLSGFSGRLALPEKPATALSFELSLRQPLRCWPQHPALPLSGLFAPRKDRLNGSFCPPTAESIVL
jgi:hypothetical protein